HRLEQHVVEAQDNALYPLLHFVLDDLPTSTKSAEPDDSNTTSILRAARADENMTVDEKLMGMYLSWLVWVGFLPAPEQGKGIPLPELAGAVFLDAPIMLQPVDMPGGIASAEALDTIKAAPEEPELQPRAWWRANQDKTVYYHVAETIEYLKNYLKDQRFNGVFGFSQGACMAAALTKILEQPEAYPAILVDGKAPHPPL
ncbi:large subunit of alpha-aminoadipate reductase, partial [Ceratobasidium sp. 423]